MPAAACGRPEPERPGHRLHRAARRRARRARGRPRPLARNGRCGRFPDASPGLPSPFRSSTAARRATSRSRKPRGARPEILSRAAKSSVAVEVRNAAVTLDTAAQRIDAAKAGRAAAETQLRAEKERYGVGLSTNFFVLTRQNDLAQAVLTETAALTDYRRALTDFARAVGIPPRRAAHRDPGTTLRPRRPKGEREPHANAHRRHPSSDAPPPRWLPRCAAVPGRARPPRRRLRSGPSDGPCRGKPRPPPHSRHRRLAADESAGGRAYRARDLQVATFGPPRAVRLVEKAGAVLATIDGARGEGPALTRSALEPRPGQVRRSSVTASCAASRFSVAKAETSASARPRPRRSRACREGLH